MKPTFFVSDAHLGFADRKTENEREKRLIAFFQFVQKKGDSLYIVGDLFDFWFEYQSVIPRRYFDILLSLKNLVNGGIKVGYITGNHDFWMDSFFENQLHIPVYRTPIEIKIHEKRLYIAHGDGLAKKDVAYRMLKKFLQHPLNILLYRIVHPDIGFALAGFFSRLSRNHREIKNRDAEYIAFAKSRFTEGYDAVVLAHTHRPQEFQYKNQIYINTGDWIEHFTYGKFERGRLSLEYWEKEK